MSKDIVVTHRGHLPDYGINFVADIPTVFHCHHFNLFWDQTIDDALGPELGAVIRSGAARESFYDLLSSIAARSGAQTVDERMQIAHDVFMGTGQGRLQMDISPTGGSATGDFLHYGYTWNEKYGRRIRRHHPADALAAGFLSAATEFVHGLSRESVRTQEVECVAKRDRQCRFEISVGEPAPLAGPVSRREVEAATGSRIEGRFEDRIRPIVEGLREFLGGVIGDERGLIQAFGLFITQHPSTYYNRSGYDALRHISRTAPQSVEVMRDLLREAGHVCVFSTFGNIMSSPEWEGLVGRPTGDRDEILIGCMALARALGMGQWCVHDFDPGRRFVLRTPSTYEALYYVNREGRALEASCFFLQGAALAIMQLAERVPWAEQPDLDNEFYQNLCKQEPPWSSRETLCVSKGDPCCEVVVELR